MLLIWDEVVGMVVDIVGFNCYLLDCIYCDVGVLVYIIYVEVEGIVYVD